MPAAKPAPNFLDGLVKQLPKAEKQRMKLADSLGPKGGASYKSGYEAGKQLALGDKTGVARLAELMGKQPF